MLEIWPRPTLTGGLPFPRANCSPNGKPKIYTVIVSNGTAVASSSIGAGRCGTFVTFRSARSRSGSIATATATALVSAFVPLRK